MLGQLCTVGDLPNIKRVFYYFTRGSLFIELIDRRNKDLKHLVRLVDAEGKLDAIDGTWDVITNKGNIHAEHVVNCGGLWAKQVGLMAGLDLPVTPMEHHYLVTETIPEIAAMTSELPLIVDLEAALAHGVGDVHLLRPLQTPRLGVVAVVEPRGVDAARRRRGAART